MVYTGAWCCYMFTLPLLYLSQSLFVWYVLLLARFQPLVSSLNWNRWSINYALKIYRGPNYDPLDCSPAACLSLVSLCHPSSASLFIPLLFEFISTLSTSREWKGGFVLRHTSSTPTLYCWEKTESLEI